MKAKKLALSKFDFERGISAEFRNTTSRGRDTYGYNICTLYINGEKVSSCNGGGYDMRGTALGNWMEVQFTEELKGLKAHSNKQNHELVRTGRAKGFYGLFFLAPNEAYGSRAKWKEGARVHLDGGCGISEMQKILNAIGYGMRYIPTRKKNDALYMIEPMKVTA